ncbi:hypothetical protein HPG69_005788 [Diceros bicornis minor]|uniref:Uncharacterized protein n=1 Tax=Diceros bicornis minor TaxID=77932 RepID=A0A7J7ESH9_DICBM|nr:hypothetical protein HPG69_005788 [Diceros bicornis minor]
MANIVKRLREVKFSPEEEQKRDICVHHQKTFLLFCEEDGKVICWLCERSKEHCGHHIFLMEEVAQDYQEKLQAALERLRKEQQEAEKLEADAREEITTWKNQIQSEKQHVQAAFKQLRDILDCEEQKELLALNNEVGDVLDNPAESENALVQQSQLMRALISDVEHQLQGQQRRCCRSETWTLKKPEMFSRELKHVFQVPDLKGMLQMSKVEAMLEPVNFVSNIVLSEDQRQVRVMDPVMSLNTDSCDFSAFDVLGHKCFTLGKRVSRKTDWILGVCNAKNYFNRTYFFQRTSSKSVNHTNVYSTYRPQYGYWVIGLQSGSEYNVFEDSPTSDPKVLTLSMAVPPHHVGVFLDSEACTVSLFNVTIMGHSCTSSLIIFSGMVYPYFNPWNCPRPITVCPPSS